MYNGYRICAVAMRRNLSAIRKNIHVRESTKIKMADLIGAIIAILLCLFLLSPVLLVIYMLTNSIIDVNGDGKNDI
jgi:hypothetical protein